MFGIDKHNMGSFKIDRKHDFEKLFSHDNIKTNSHGEKLTFYDENTGEKFEYQCITILDDEKFNSFHVGLRAKKQGNRKIYQEYAKLELFVENDEGTKNLKPISQSEVIENQKEILKYIRDKYGLNLSMEGSKYTYLEINKTIKMNEDVEKYYYVLEYLKLVAPQRYKFKTDSSNGKNEYTMITIENNSIRIKLYNKTKQLEKKGIELEEYYLRIELCLQDSKKVKSVFGTAIIEEITDDMMWEYFKKVVETDLFDRLEAQLKKSKVELKKELKLQKAEDKKKYPKNFVVSTCSLMYKDTKIPLILDVEQSYEVLKPSVSRWDRTIKTIIKAVDKRPHKKNNLARYNEIKTKILDLN